MLGLDGLLKRPPEGSTAILQACRFSPHRFASHCHLQRTKITSERYRGRRSAQDMAVRIGGHGLGFQAAGESLELVFNRRRARDGGSRRRNGRAADNHRIPRLPDRRPSLFHAFECTLLSLSTALEPDVTSPMWVGKRPAVGVLEGRFWAIGRLALVGRSGRRLLCSTAACDGFRRGNWSAIAASMGRWPARGCRPAREC